MFQKTKLNIAFGSLGLSSGLLIGNIILLHDWYALVMQLLYLSISILFVLELRNKLE